jgi:hypothetical protein
MAFESPQDILVLGVLVIAEFLQLIIVSSRSFT